MQIAPLPLRQVAQAHLADAHALERSYFQPHSFAHAADLALFAFNQHKAQLLGVLPIDLCGFEGLAGINGENRFNMYLDRKMCP